MFPCVSCALSCFGASPLLRWSRWHREPETQRQAPRIILCRLARESWHPSRMTHVETLLGAPGLTASNKKLLGPRGKLSRRLLH